MVEASYESLDRIVFGEAMSWSAGVGDICWDGVVRLKRFGRAGPDVAAKSHRPDDHPNVNICAHPFRFTTSHDFRIHDTIASTYARAALLHSVHRYLVCTLP